MDEQCLRVRVAGRDRTPDLGLSVLREARQRELPWLEKRLEEEHEVLALAAASDPSAFLARYLAALRTRWQVETDMFTAPSGPGLAGALTVWARTLLWRLFRYQHDWVTFRQNAVNAQLLSALALECEERARQVRDLEARVRDLEAMVGTAGNKALKP